MDSIAIGMEQRTAGSRTDMAQSWRSKITGRLKDGKLVPCNKHKDVSTRLRERRVADREYQGGSRPPHTGRFLSAPPCAGSSLQLIIRSK